MSLSRDQSEEAWAKMENDLSACWRMRRNLDGIQLTLQALGDDAFQDIEEVKSARRQLFDLMRTMAYVEALLLPQRTKE